MRVIALIDGEHHPGVARAALDRLASEHDVVAVLFVGGEEKVSRAVLDRPAEHYGRDVEVAGGSAREALAALAGRVEAEAVADLSGEPVLEPDARLELAAVALHAGLEYRSPGVRIAPPPRERIEAAVPLVEVIGTGKRTGKTAVAGHLATLLRARGHEPVIVSMGRGGPPLPQLVAAGERLDSERLLEIARAGRHAASDYLEDALVTGVAAVGCRRCGEGPAGETYDSNLIEGVRLALTLDPDVVLVEGSGAAVPPVEADRRICVTTAPLAERQALSHLGPYRLLGADLVVLLGADAVPVPVREDVERRIAEWSGSGTVVPCRLEPEPVGELPRGARAAFFSTAPAGFERLRDRLARDGVELCVASANLARRSELERDLATAVRERCDLFLTELKAASIELVGEEAQRRGVPFALVRNRPVSLPGEPDLDERLERLHDEACAAARPQPAAALEEQ